MNKQCQRSKNNKRTNPINTCVYFISQDFKVIITYFRNCFYKKKTQFILPLANNRYVYVLPTKDIHTRISNQPQNELETF